MAQCGLKKIPAVDDDDKFVFGTLIEKKKKCPYRVNDTDHVESIFGVLIVSVCPIDCRSDGGRGEGVTIKPNYQQWKRMVYSQKIIIILRLHLQHDVIVMVLIMQEYSSDEMTQLTMSINIRHSVDLTVNGCFIRLSKKKKRKCQGSSWWVMNNAPHTSMTSKKIDLINFFYCSFFFSWFSFSRTNNNTTSSKNLSTFFCFSLFLILIDVFFKIILFFSDSWYFSFL